MMLKPTTTRIESPFYTVEEAMAYLRLSRKTVDSLIKRGLLRSSAAIRHKRLLKEDVHSFHARTAPKPYGLPG